MGLLRFGVKAGLMARRLSRAANETQHVQVDPLTLGGTRRLDGLKPKRLTAIAVLVRGTGLILFGAVVLLSLIPGYADVAWIWSRIVQLSALTALTALVALFVVRVSRERARGLFPACAQSAFTPSFELFAVVAWAISAATWFLAEGVPDSRFALLLSQTGTWLFLVAVLSGVTAAIASGRAFVKLRKAEYERVKKFEGIIFRVSSEGMKSAETHAAFHFREESVRIYPVPAHIAANFSKFEPVLAAGNYDQMLTEESTLNDIVLVEATPECLERRETMRAWNNLIEGFDERDVPDEEILNHSVRLPADLIHPNASSPPRPHAALAAEGVTERDLPQIQEFAVAKGMTIVGHDLKRWNPERARFEKLIYMQEVSEEEIQSLQLIANRSRNGKIWDMWGEFGYVIDEGKRRIDTVIWKRPPVDGLDSEKILAHHQLIIAMLPGGNDGWPIETYPGTDLVTYKYGKPLTLPGLATYDFGLPFSYKSIPLGVNGHGELVCLGALETNILFGGSPGGGKSGGVTAYLAAIARLDNTAIIGIDTKMVEQSLWGSRFSRIAETGEDALDVLQRLEREMRRRYVWLKSKRVKKLTEDLLGQLPLIVLVIDELADVVASGVTKESKAADGDRIELLRTLIALGRAAGIVVIAATQKPQSDVIPTAIRDLIQQRVCYATMTPAQTDTVLGAGMASNGALAHQISAEEKGVCYVVNESSRVPVKVKTFWVEDSAVEAFSDSTSHLRVPLDWLDPGFDDTDDGDDPWANISR